MGLLSWLRGHGQAGTGTATSAAGLGELDAVFNPARRQQIENLQTLEMLRGDEAESGAPPRPVDLDGGTAVIRVRPDPVDPEPPGPAPS